MKYHIEKLVQHGIFSSLQNHFIIWDFLQKAHKIGAWPITSFESNSVNLHAVLRWFAYAEVLRGNLGAV
jgi:hypothetical protein